jgi:hypothetical protein
MIKYNFHITRKGAPYDKMLKAIRTLELTVEHNEEALATLDRLKQQDMTAGLDRVTGVICNNTVLQTVETIKALDFRMQNQIDGYLTHPFASLASIIDYRNRSVHERNENQPFYYFDIVIHKIVADELLPILKDLATQIQDALDNKRV